MACNRISASSALKTHDTPVQAFPAGLSRSGLKGLRSKTGEIKKSKMKEEPTISMKTKGRFWEPTMFMITQDLWAVGHDVKQRKGSY